MDNDFMVITFLPLVSLLSTRSKGFFIAGMLFRASRKNREGTNKNNSKEGHDGTI